VRCWHVGRAALVACALGVLQACSGADAVAPISPAVTPAPAPVATIAKITRVLSDTAVAGAVLALEGEQLSAGSGQFKATLDGVELTVQAVSPTRLELVLPAGAFPCTAVRALPLRVTLPTTSFEAMVPLRVAQRFSLAVGESVSLLGAQATRCVELAANGTGAQGGNARYMVAVVNSSQGAAQGASFELRGVGTGALANVTSQVTSPTASVQGVRASVSAAQAPQETGMHGVLLQQEAQHAVAGGNAVAAWQRAAPRSTANSLAQRAALVTTALQVGDLTTVTAMAGSCASGRAVRARVVYAGTKALVLEDVAAPRAGAMDAEYRQLGAEFDNVVYPLLAEQVGDPLAMNSTMAGDGRVTMLFTRFVNDSLPGTAGYVSACNFYPRSTFAASNQDELFYARVAGANETPDEWRRTMRATVVHEAKHLASFAERLSRGATFEEPWLEEATARVAEELYARTFGGGGFKEKVSFAASVGCELTQCDDRPLIMWKHFSGLHTWLRSVEQQPAGQITTGTGTALTASAANAGYSSGWALVRWVLDQYAPSERVALRTLVAGRSGVGMAALSTVAQQPQASLMAAWALSLGVQGDVDTAGAFATASWQWRDILGGMASMFPGAFSAQPLPMVQLSFGRFALPPRALSGTASYTALEGAAGGASQIVELRTSATSNAAAGQPVSMTLAVSRTR